MNNSIEQLRESGRLGNESQKRTREILRKTQIIEYENNPNFCKFCGNKIEFDKRNNIFCNASCSAKFNNKLRTSDSYEKQKKSLRETNLKKGLLNDKLQKSLVCSICGNNFHAIKKRKTCSDKCLRISLREAGSLGGKSSGYDKTLYYAKTDRLYSKIENKFYTIYKTTNLINDKFYIGKHETFNLNDNYLGSGKYLSAAIKKYGKNNFKKEILFIFDNEHEMNLKEIELVNEELVNSEMTYNLGIGGEGGPHFKGKKHSDETKEKNRISSTGRVNSEETRKKISEKGKNRIVTEETRQKLSERALNRFKSSESRNKISKSMLGKRHSMESRQKMSDTKKGKSFVMSEEQKIKLSIANKGKRKSIETIEKMKISLKNKYESGVKNNNFGTIWIYNIELKKRKMINPELLNEYLENNWEEGYIKF